MAPPREVLDLVERFERNREAYHSGRYKEAQVRLEFINPLFEALGWDVRNVRGHAEAYKDVIYEDAIRVKGGTKAPDYCFRIGGARKFFVEAKKPSVDIKDDVHPAYQLRRYAWSAKLPLSVLTDFEEFALYDCRVRPGARDKASAARIMYLSCEDYAARWDEIADIFSREAVLKGSFDRYAESKRKKRGTAEVDDAFLKEIEGWREALAKNIAKLNPKLTQRELNFAVQRTIDRVIFLRMCEDRGVENYGALQGLLNGANTYKRLFALFSRADERYNSGLFHFEKEKGRSTPPDELTPRLRIDDKVLKDILRRLYYPESPYEFSVLPADILGQVYEQFLGKVIRLTAGHRAVVEDKPEVKKAGGVYYTPTYIVDYIVRNTVGKLLEGRTPKQVRGDKRRPPLRVLDPACGSGSFLLGAYRYLLDWYRDEYCKSPEEYAKALDKTPAGWRLTTAEKKRILLDHIFGVDIDPQAVEVTKLSLLLKVLEGESAATLESQLRMFHERALPDLGANIKCGNSLIGPDFYEGKQGSLFDEDERYRVNAFDWKGKHGFPEVFSGRNPGFDAVIGNPPYDVLEKERGKSSWPHMALTEYVRAVPEYESALGGKLNLFRFFVVRSLQLTRKDGHYGMIIPLALLADISCAATRRCLFRNSTSLNADCFPQKDRPSRRVFVRAKLSTAVITCRRAAARDERSQAMTVRVYPGNSFEEKHKTCVIAFADTLLLDRETAPIPLTDELSWALCRKLHAASSSRRLGDISDFDISRGEINQTIYRQFITHDKRLARLLKGVEVGQYRVHSQLSQGEREWLNEKAFLRTNKPRQAVSQQRIAIQRITGVDECLRVVATLVRPPTYFADSTNSIIARPGAKHDLRYLLGLLNSRLTQWRFKLTSTNNNVGTNELACLPIRTIDFTNPDDKSRHDRMVSLVDRMLALHKTLPEARTPHEKTRIEREIAATDRQIDALVYELYGLTEEEIAIVERQDV